MSSPKLPQDANKNPIPVLGYPDNKGYHPLTATDTSSKNATAFDAKTMVISVYASVPIHFRFGGSGVSATTADHSLPVGYHDIAINHDLAGGEAAKELYMAVIRKGATSGEVTISERI